MGASLEDVPGLHHVVVHPVSIARSSMYIYSIMLIVMVILIIVITINSSNNTDSSIARFPLRRFSPGAGLLRSPCVHR